MLPAHWTLPASISVLCDFYGQINQYLICDSLLTPANPMERSATEGGRQLLWLRPSRGLNRTSGRTCVDRLRTFFSNGELPLSLQKEPESSHLHLHLHLNAWPQLSEECEQLWWHHPIKQNTDVGDVWSCWAYTKRYRWCSHQSFIGGIIWSLCEMRQEHVVWWEAGQQTLLRTVTEHTAVKSFCQSDLRHGAINQQVLERTWKQQSHDGWVNAASSLSSHWVWVRGKRGGWRSGLPVATGSSSHDLHISDRPTGGKCKIQLLAFFFLVQISHLFFCACVFFFWMLPVVASHCCGFLNSKPTVLPLHMHVYLIRSCFPREWDVRPVCEQCFYWGHFCRCQVGKMKNDKSWCKCELTAGIFFLPKGIHGLFFHCFGQYVSMSKFLFQNIQEIK